jgi:hypothetical protein
MVERTEWSDAGWVAFEDLLQESARRDLRTSTKTLLQGNVWHEPLPLELARDREPLVRLLRASLAAAGVPTSPDVGGVAGRVLLGATTALLVAVNERPEPATRRLVVDRRAIAVPTRARGAALMLVDRATGAVIGSTKP